MSDIDIGLLNKNHCIPGVLEFIEAEGGLPFILIKNSSAKAKISLFGGQVLSFQPVERHENLLFLSKLANYDGKKAIRGGVPVCWPWFGDDPDGLGRPSHGFARHSLWQVASTQTINDFATRVILQLLPTPTSIAMWPYAFELKLEITIADTLTLELVTRNKGDKLFTISQALHAYFNIGDISRVQILGLENKRYFDKLDEGKQKQQLGALKVSEEVDRIYTEVQNRLSIDDPILGRQIKIVTTGSKTSVVWNPWAQTCAKMADLEPDDYQRFICVEASKVEPDLIMVAPGEEHRMVVNYQILTISELGRLG